MNDLYVFKFAFDWVRLFGKINSAPASKRLCCNEENGVFVILDPSLCHSEGA